MHLSVYVVTCIWEVKERVHVHLCSAKGWSLKFLLRGFQGRVYRWLSWNSIQTRLASNSGIFLLLLSRVLGLKSCITIAWLMSFPIACYWLLESEWVSVCVSHFNPEVTSSATLANLLQKSLIATCHTGNTVRLAYLPGIYVGTGNQNLIPMLVWGMLYRLSHPYFCFHNNCGRR